MSTESDPVERYLDDLMSKLYGAPSHVRRVLAESEAHLRDAIDGNLAAGMLPEAASSAALSSFGSAAQVAAAVNRAGWATARGPGLRAAAALVARLAAVGMIVIGISAAAARLVAALTSTTTVFGLPSGARIPAVACAHWLAVQPTAHTCRQAGTLEASSDLTMYLGLVGVLGVLLLGVILLLQSRSPASMGVFPPILAPAIGAAIFGTAAVGLGALTASNAVVSMAWGLGFWSTTAACAFVAALVCAGRVLRVPQGRVRHRQPRQPAAGPARSAG
jgi:hypothetical protein